MSASPPNPPPSPAAAAGDQQSEPLYVKLPPPRVARGAGHARHAWDALIYRGLGTLAFVLCATLPISSGLIMVLLLLQPGTHKHGLIWLWVVMFLFVETVAVLVAVGIWREVSGGAGVRRRDYLP